MDVTDKRADSRHSTFKWHLQTLSCFIMLLFISSFVLSISLSLYILLCTRYYPLALIYYAWVWYDHDSRDSLERRSQRARGWALWRHVRDYFSARLVKTAELDPTLSYMFCAFPHGALGFGSFVNFGTDATKVKEAFPHHTCYFSVLSLHFILFFCRELGHSLGVCSSSSKSISNVLSTPKSIMVIIVGGAAESLETRPGRYTVVLKQRKGFVKLALRHGTPLVPVITFGEPDLYDQVDNPEGSWLRRCQEFIRKIISFAPLIAYGNGPLPYRRKIISVVGKPLPMEKIPNPTQEQIDDLHQRFITELEAHFEEHKKFYVANYENTYLIIK